MAMVYHHRTSVVSKSKERRREGEGSLCLCFGCMEDSEIDLLILTDAVRTSTSRDFPGQLIAYRQSIRLESMEPFIFFCNCNSSCWLIFSGEVIL